MNSKNSFLEIFSDFIKNHPKQFLLLVIVLIIDGIVSSISVLAILPLTEFLIDPSLKSPNLATKIAIDIMALLNFNPGYWSFGLLFAITNLIKSFVDIVIRYLILRIKYEIQFSLFSKSIRGFFGARWCFFSDLDQGKVLNIFQKEIANIGDTMGQLATQLARLFQLIIYLAIPMWMNAELTFITIFLSLLFGSPIFFIHKLSYRLGLKNIESGNSLTRGISETFSASKLIIGNALQSLVQGRLFAFFNNHVNATIKSQTLESSISLAYQPLGMLAVVISFGIGLNQGSNLAEMAALLWALLRMLPILSQLMTSGIVINSFLPSYQQLVKLNKEAANLKEWDGVKQFVDLREGIELKNIKFRYLNGFEALNGVSLKIKKGSLTALAGRSGSGKSTIADIILGLQIPQQGQIYFDGTPLTSFDLNSLRTKVGYVSQDPFLFNTSIRNNLLMIRPDATDDELWAVCRMANASSFINEMEGGLDAQVGERGANISGGQRQRISLARALLGNPEIIILDEATSALDPESEKLIQKSIEKIAIKTTVLIIAHRLSTIASSDYVYVLDGGYIVEEGNYEELSKKHGGVLSKFIYDQQI